MRQRKFACLINVRVALRYRDFRKTWTTLIAKEEKGFFFRACSGFSYHLTHGSGQSFNEHKEITTRR